MKIVKSYIDNILQDNNDKIIVEQIIELSNKLGLKTVAEGIELAKQKELLLKYDCDYGQGYYLSRPINFEVLLEVLQG